ncbi:MAG: helix-hairpin-helix domain-containing protein, partial [Eubacteriales bacterium]|nr:helix-hairpin-helix domain-containing protein [Eubacteriales bacterium]
LPTLPERIEGYDISNTQGVLSVASMVVFHGGLPAKKQYRHFRIKTVEGANDFASMAEVIGRRFTHGLQEKHERQQAGLPVEEGRFSRFPDVVLIDGGPQQLLFAHNAMLDAGVDLPMFGLAKRFEEIYLPGRADPIVLDKRSNALHLVQRVRDEAHRFGITHHRALRSKAGIASELSQIEGIGEKRKIALLRAFGSVPAILAADVETLRAVEGMNAKAAQAVADYARAKQAKADGKSDE